MARGKRWKTTTRESALVDALDYASDISGLASEMRSWAENTEESFPAKSEEVGEVADTLETGHSEIEAAVTAIHEAVDETKAVADAKVTYIQMTPYGRKPTPRHMTLANALAPMSAAAEYLQELDVDDDILEEELADHDQDINGLGTLGEELASAISEVESVDFPGMY